MMQIPRIIKAILILKSNGRKNPIKIKAIASIIHTAKIAPRIYAIPFLSNALALKPQPWLRALVDIIMESYYLIPSPTTPS